MHRAVVADAASRVIALLASATRQELARQVAYLKEENRILRSRLPAQISVTAKDRQRLIRGERKLSAQLKELISMELHRFQSELKSTVVVAGVLRPPKVSTATANK